MSGVSDPCSSEFEQAHSAFNEGLKVCRVVVDNYRAMLGDDRIDNRDQNEAQDPDYGSWQSGPEGAN